MTNALLNFKTNLYLQGDTNNQSNQKRYLHLEDHQPLREASNLEPFHKKDNVKQSRE